MARLFEEPTQLLFILNCQLSIIHCLRPHRLMVRTAGFQSVNGSSILPGAANIERSLRKPTAVHTTHYERSTKQYTIQSMSHPKQKEAPPSKAFAYTLLVVGFVVSLLILATVPFAVGVFIMSLFQVPCLIILPLVVLFITAIGTIGGSVMLLRGSWNGLILFAVGILPTLLFLIGAGGVMTEWCPLSITGGG